MRTRNERINIQYKRDRNYKRKQKIQKISKFSILTGSSLGLAGILAKPLVTNAISNTSSQSDSSQTISSQSPSSSYNFTSNQNTQIAYLSSSQYDFLNKIGPLAKKLASENNLYASIMIAQAIIESGWGSSGLASAPNYNLFGVKGSYGGQSVAMPTYEQNSDGSSYMITADFAKYSGYEDSMKGYIKTMLNPLYVGAWRSNAKNYQDAANYLTGRYATAINYGETLISMIQKYNLTAFDSDSFNVDPSLQGISISDDSQTYTIQKGDSLWAISQKFDISFDDLLNLNNLSQDSKIYPDQVIKIKELEKVNIPNLQITSNPTETENKPSLPISTTTDNSNKDSDGSYTVQKNDSLYKIALKLGISLDDLLKLNNLNQNSNIQPGQKLITKDKSIVHETKSEVNTDNNNSNNLDNKKSDISNNSNNVTNNNEYTVVEGDSLYKIALNNHVSVDDLLKLNNLTSDATIKPGQKLIIKNNTDKSTAQSTNNEQNKNVDQSQTTNKSNAQTSTTPLDNSSNSYTVQQGDNLYKIAQKYNISLNDLLSLNKDLNENSSLNSGQIITIKDNKEQVKVSTSSIDSSNVYIVKKDDNLANIAKSNNISLSDLLKFNNLNENSEVKEGQQLLLRSQDSKSSNEDSNIYIVQQGDDIAKIAKDHNLSVEDLLNFNSMTKDSTITVGQSLFIKNNNSESVKDSENNIAPTPQKTYTVKQGDSLYKIATANETTVNILEKLNDLPEGIVFPGQVIKLN